MSTMLSRSGRSSPDGKLTQRFDIPVSEELSEKAIVAASMRGVPKAEFLRDVLEQALANGCWFPLTDESARALDVLAAIADEPPGKVLADLVNDALIERFSMVQMIVRTSVSGQVDESRNASRRIA